jgi:hypothetical protein
LAVGLWLCLYLPARACAQAVALDMSACERPAPDVVRALVGLELRERLLQAGAALPSDAQVVEIRCSELEAQLWLRGTEARKRVALASVPVELRARLLALSVAELARPLALTTPAFPPPLAAAYSPPTAASPAPIAAPRYLLWAGMEAHATPLFALGGALLLRVKLHALVSWSSAGSLTLASIEIDRGELRVLQVSLRSGLALVLFDSSLASLQLGAGVRGGWLRLRGEPADAERTTAAHFSAFYLGPALFAGAVLHVLAPLFVALELELSHSLREARANVEDGNARTLSPWRSSAVLGAGLAW